MNLQSSNFMALLVVVSKSREPTINPEKMGKTRLNGFAISCRECPWMRYAFLVAELAFILHWNLWHLISLLLLVCFFFFWFVLFCMNHFICMPKKVCILDIFGTCLPPRCMCASVCVCETSRPFSSRYVSLIILISFSKTKTLFSFLVNSLF